jgi:nitrite reductase/ring-hydroxylating ferredoxin subunit
MARRERLICAADALAERGRGVRFELERFGKPRPAFAVRVDGQPHAFLNQCGHVPVEVGPVSTHFASALLRESDGCKARCAGKGYSLAKRRNDADALSRGNPEGRVDSGAPLWRRPLAVLAQRRVPLRGLHPESTTPQLRNEC